MVATAACSGEPVGRGTAATERRSGHRAPGGEHRRRRVGRHGGASGRERQHRQRDRAHHHGHQYECRQSPGRAGWCVPGPSRPLGRSGERRRGCASSGTRHGSVALRTALAEAAHTATRATNTYLAAHHAHIRNRRGLPNAIGATRHDLLIADWHLMHDQVDYGDLARTAPSAATPPGAALAG
jgi:hypothetical protein